MKSLFRKRELSLNHAPLTDADIRNLQMRQSLIANAQAEIMKWQSIKAMLIDADNLYKRELLKAKKLRKGKEYVFDYEHKYVHRPDMKPWENGQAPLEKKGIPKQDEQTPAKESEHA